MESFSEVISMIVAIPLIYLLPAYLAWKGSEKRTGAPSIGWAITALLLTWFGFALWWLFGTRDPASPTTVRLDKNAPPSGFARSTPPQKDGTSRVAPTYSISTQDSTEMVGEETCAIEAVAISSYGGLSEFGVGRTHTWEFRVKAFGPQGIRDVAKTTPFKANTSGKNYGAEPHQHDDVVNLLENLVSDLISEGWQPDGRGEYWFSYRFRRQVPVLPS